MENSYEKAAMTHSKANNTMQSGRRWQLTLIDAGDGSGDVTLALGQTTP
jgi:hypothetical protein